MLLNQTVPVTKRVKQDPTRAGLATRPSTRSGTLSRPNAGTKKTHRHAREREILIRSSTGARVLPPNKRLTTASARPGQHVGRTTSNSVEPGLRQRVIVGKKKAAAAALSAHRAEEAATGELDLEEDENYDDDSDDKRKRSKKVAKATISKKTTKKQHISAKGTLLWSAEKVLREEKKPMKASEIIAKGREKGT